MLPTGSIFFFFLIRLLNIFLFENIFSGNIAPAQIPEDWIDIKDGCERKMRLQIQEEIKASVVYLSMGAYFSRDTVNRPGFAKMFINAASEEREHGMKLMEYLLVRGKLTKNLSGLIAIPAVEKTEWANGAAALEDALKLEAHVTRSIREVIKTCENADNFNDYHVSFN